MIRLNENYQNLKDSYLFYNIAQKTKKTRSVKAKFSRTWMLTENRNRYFGTFTFVKMLAFPDRLLMPEPVDCANQLKVKSPQNR